MVNNIISRNVLNQCKFMFLHFPLWGRESIGKVNNISVTVCVPSSICLKIAVCVAAAAEARDRPEKQQPASSSLFGLNAQFRVTGAFKIFTRVAHNFRRNTVYEQYLSREENGIEEQASFAIIKGRSACIVEINAMYIRRG